jgi:hypothetical protein
MVDVSFQKCHEVSKRYEKQTKICNSLVKLENIQVSQKWRTNYLLPYRGCLNVHEKNMENIFQTKKLIFIIIIINGNTM